MKIIFDPDIIGPWVCARGGGKYIPGRATAVGLINEDGQLVAGVLYEDYNGANVMVHISAEGDWAIHRKYLWMIFDYPFNQLKVNRITAVTADSNYLIQSLVDRLGFELEFKMKDAHPDGALLIYKMTRDQCRWLALKEHPYEVPA